MKLPGFHLIRAEQQERLLPAANASQGCGDCAPKDLKIVGWDPQRWEFCTDNGAPCVAMKRGEAEFCVSPNSFAEAIEKINKEYPGDDNKVQRNSALRELLEFAVSCEQLPGKACVRERDTRVAADYAVSSLIPVY